MAQPAPDGQGPGIDVGQIGAIVSAVAGGLATAWGAVKGIQAARRESRREAVDAERRQRLDRVEKENQSLKYAFELVDQLRMDIRRMRDERALDHVELVDIRKELAAAYARISELERRVNREERRRPSK
jgi:hypothetical protein